MAFWPIFAVNLVFTEIFVYSDATLIPTPPPQFFFVAKPLCCPECACACELPWHPVKPSPEKPLGQSPQINPPIVLLHVVNGSQPPLPVAHSFISVL